MKTKLITLFLLLLYTAFSTTADAAVTTNAWSSTTAGTFKWETASDWSLGILPSIAQSSIQITNVSIPAPHQNRQKTVEIDSTTASGFSSSMTVSNLLVEAPIFNQNTLLLNNTGSIALNILSSLVVSNHGVVSMANSALNFALNTEFIDNGTVLLNAGSSITGTSVVYIGKSGQGTWTMDDGTSFFVTAVVGYQSGSSGTFNINGGTNNIFHLEMASFANSTGTVWITGGLFNGGVVTVGGGGVAQMTVSNGTLVTDQIFVGSLGVGTLNFAGGTTSVSFDIIVGSTQNTGVVWMTGGQLTAAYSYLEDPLIISNGVWQTDELFLGSLNTQSQGTLLVAGGVCAISSNMVIGSSPAGTSDVWVADGQLMATNGQTLVASNGVGELTVSNGTWLARDVGVGSTIKSFGTLTVAGGTSILSSTLTIGSPSCTGTGIVTVVGGNLFVTNAAGNAVLDLESGTLTLSGGTLVTDVLVATNPCASFQQTGGTLIVGGVTNVFTPLPFVITSIASDGHSIFIRWQTPGGVTNTVQATNGNPDGSYNTNFVDLSPPLLIAGPSTNQYNDIGGATNMPSRFYRVRLVP
jgi:hypothetical protein